MAEILEGPQRINDLPSRIFAYFSGIIRHQTGNDWCTGIVMLLRQGGRLTVTMCGLLFIGSSIVFKAIVNTSLLCNFNSMSLRSLYCANVPLRYCLLTQ